MPALTIRNIPEATLERLRTRARFLLDLSRASLFGADGKSVL